MTLTADQMALRKGKITASIVPMILGVSPYGGLQSAYDRILGLDDFTGNDQTVIGQCLEAGIADFWSKKTGLSVHKEDQTQVRQGWMGATADFLVAECLPDTMDWLTLLEIKTLSAETFALWGDCPPPSVECQARWQMAVYNLHRCHVAAYADTKRWRFYVIDRDFDLESNMIEIAGAFYENHIRPRIRPDSDDRAEPPSPIILPHKGRVRTVEPGSGADLLGIEAIELTDLKQARQAEIKLIDERLDAIKAELVPELGDAETLCGNGWALRAATVKGRIDWQQVALDACEDGERLSEAKLKHTGPETVRLTLKGV